MEIKLKLISERIELLRSLLYSLISYKQLTDRQVIDCSQELDKLLYEFEKCKKTNLN